MDNPIKRYLVDAIAAEKSFETQLRGFAKEATLAQARTLFEQHAEETRLQYEQLTSRLEALGGSPSTMKSLLAHVFNLSPKAAQLGHDDRERTTQDLIMAFSVENAEIAMYEALITAAEATGDSETAALARRIQAQERETAEKVWNAIEPAANVAFNEAVARDQSESRNAIVRYLQDAEAAERNFEDALAGFGKSGDQASVQSLFTMMSEKARRQYERLDTRLASLGASRSAAKSALAHLLAFSPLSAQFGHEPSEKNTQHLMVTYSAAAAEIAMYEALAVAASAAGDQETSRLARELQAEEKEDHRLAWEYLPQSARASLQAVLSEA
jgi:ferritin-like metal-binding protein YciE